LGAVQVVLLQQGWPAPPQVPQVPSWQIPAEAIPQLAPAAMHRLPTQQPPEAQLFPWQHGSPGRPHSTPSTVVPSRVEASVFPPVPAVPTGTSPPPSVRVPAAPALPVVPAAPPATPPAAVLPPLPAVSPPMPPAPAPPLTPAVSVPPVPVTG
jgi:hypothetical protein